MEYRSLDQGSGDLHPSHWLSILGFSFITCTKGSDYLMTDGGPFSPASHQLFPWALSTFICNSMKEIFQWWETSTSKSGFGAHIYVFSFGTSMHSTVSSCPCLLEMVGQCWGVRFQLSGQRLWWQLDLISPWWLYWMLHLTRNYSAIYFNVRQIGGHEPISLSDCLAQLLTALVEELESNRIIQGAC